MLLKQNKILNLLLTAIVLVSCAPASLAQKCTVNNSNSNTAAIASYNEGVQLFAANRTEDGIDCFRRALSLNPSLTQCHSPLAQLLFKAGSYSEAESEFKAAICAGTSSQSELATLWCLLGIASTHTNNNSQAADAFAHYLSLQPNGTYATEAQRSLKLLSQKSPQLAIALTGGADGSSAGTATSDMVKKGDNRSDNNRSDYLNANHTRRWQGQETLKVFIASGADVAGYQPEYRELFKSPESMDSRIQRPHQVCPGQPPRRCASNLLLDLRAC